ncbi:MAG TPA: DUF6429 family protein [Sphingomonas sp.]|nr:DUF6429 family protein [Sphingomonas sp.]
MSEPRIDTDLIDEAVLALLFLTLHKDSPTEAPLWRAWKSFDWDAMARLHDKGLIANPAGKAKAVQLTEQGRRRCEEAFNRLFTRS